VSSKESEGVDNVHGPPRCSHLRSLRPKLAWVCPKLTAYRRRRCLPAPASRRSTHSCSPLRQQGRFGKALLVLIIYTHISRSSLPPSSLPAGNFARMAHSMGSCRSNTLQGGHRLSGTTTTMAQSGRRFAQITGQCCCTISRYCLDAQRRRAILMDDCMPASPYVLTRAFNFRPILESSITSRSSTLTSLLAFDRLWTSRTSRTRTGIRTRIPHRSRRFCEHVLQSVWGAADCQPLITSSLSFCQDAAPHAFIRRAASLRAYRTGPPPRCDYKSSQHKSP
jgi:hypothetical protein